MNRLLRQAKRGERGSAAVEFAVMLIFVLIPLLAGGLFFGRFFWHYTVAQKAAQDAAMFIARASPTEMKTQCTVFIFRGPCVVMAGMSLATKELQELSPGNGALPEISILCDDGTCFTTRGIPLPKMISVEVTMNVQDPFLSGFTELFTGSPLHYTIRAGARAHYVGS